MLRDIGVPISSTGVAMILVGGGQPPGHASVLHTCEAVADTWGLRAFQQSAESWVIYNLGKLTVQLILNIPLLLLAMYSRIQL